MNTFWRLLVTLVCAGAILALPLSSSAKGNLAGPSALAVELGFSAPDHQIASLIPYWGWKP